MAEENETKSLLTEVQNAIHCLYLFINSNKSNLCFGALLEPHPGAPPKKHRETHARPHDPDRTSTGDDTFQKYN